jgi:thermitase
MTNFFRFASLVLVVSSIGFTISTRNPAAETKPTSKELNALATQPYGKNWGLNKFIGVNAYEAWKTTQGSKDIVVAVVDTGIDLNHPSLTSNLWTNPGESGLDQNGRNKATNKVDDDADGLVDNVHGWDFVQESDVNSDYHGHGTHVAGIIAATVDMKAGRGGVAPRVKVSGYTYYVSDGNVDKNPTAKKLMAQGLSRSEALNNHAMSKLNAENTKKALVQAIKDGAQIINYSGGGSNPDDEEKAAIELAGKKGILVIVAAGNERSDMDQPGRDYYPCNYNLPNIICVGNIDSHGQIPSSSNKGIKYVHVFAPGQDIFSTLPGGQFGPMTGTSQATAFVSGVAALILSQDPSLTPKQVKNLIMNTVDKVDSLKHDCLSQGKVNAAAALAGIKDPNNYLFNEEQIKKTLLAEKVKKNTRFVSSEELKW